MEAKTVLVIDDDDGSLQFMEIILEEEGFRAILHKGSKGVVALVQQEKPDLVLLGMEVGAYTDGFALLQLLKLQDSEARLPFVLFRVNRSFLSANTALLKSLDCYWLEDPLDLNQLVALVQRLVADRDRLKDQAVGPVAVRPGRIGGASGPSTFVP